MTIKFEKGTYFFFMVTISLGLEEKYGAKGGKIQWLWDGCIFVIESDGNLMDMWDHIKSLNKHFQFHQ